MACARHIDQVCSLLNVKINDPPYRQSILFGGKDLAVEKLWLTGSDSGVSCWPSKS